MIALLSLVPIALYLVVLRSFDAFSMVRWRTILCWMAWGVASALLTCGLVKLAHATGHAWTAPWVSPVIEEVLKALPLLYLVWRRKAVFTAETQLFGEAVGGGFALVENVIYLLHFPHMDFATALVRGLGTGLLHMGCTALVATLTLVCVQHLSRRHRAGIGLAPLFFLPSVAFHTFHNVADVSPMTFMVLMMLVFFVTFYVVYRIGERGVVAWLDVSMENDVKLIAALREGRLAETKAGEYLTQLREHFEPLVFFDMCVYVQLYLELLIQSKARVMLRDAGIEQPMTPEQTEARKARLAELDAIRHRVPRMAIHLLRPLVHATDKDEWAVWDNFRL